jgi:hypothetical protein
LKITLKHLLFYLILKAQWWISNGVSATLLSKSFGYRMGVVSNCGSYAAEKIAMSSCFLSGGESRITGEDAHTATFQAHSLSGLATILTD